MTLSSRTTGYSELSVLASEPPTTDEFPLRESEIGAIVANEEWYRDGLVIVVVGASGDLAKKKTYPSLLNLFAAKLMPASTIIWGYARSKKTHQELRDQIKPFLIKSCGAVASEDVIEAFLMKCYYKSGDSYGDVTSWRDLVGFVEDHEGHYPHKRHHNRLFYLAVPPNVFGETGVAIRKTAMTTPDKGWSRLIIEKPFGRDLESCEELSRTLANEFEEHHLYRIDHYLGKEVVQNLLIWRFGNSIYEWFWHRNAIQSVLISFKEPFGTEGRGGYFDNYGIIRDILQNHLLQVLMLLTIEPPNEVDTPNAGDFIRDAKTRTLLAMSRLDLNEDVLLGQYIGYSDDETIKDKDTNCPTYAALRCRINNPRWAGVPFIMEAGKALDERKCEVRIQFHPPPAANHMFSPSTILPRNELVMRLQPDPAIYFSSNYKSPGFASTPTSIPAGMNYSTVITKTDQEAAFSNPDAYTRLILDVLRGHQGSFVRSDELRRSWEIFTPLLHKIEETKVRPHMYRYGSQGPQERTAFLTKHGVEISQESMPPTKSSL